jgi:hypothetical protein
VTLARAKGVPKSPKTNRASETSRTRTAGWREVWSRRRSVQAVGKRARRGGAGPGTVVPPSRRTSRPLEARPTGFGTVGRDVRRKKVGIEGVRVFPLPLCPLDGAPPGVFFGTVPPSRPSQTASDGLRRGDAGTGRDGPSSIPTPVARPRGHLLRSWGRQGRCCRSPGRVRRQRSSSAGCRRRATCRAR